MVWRAGSIHLPELLASVLRSRRPVTHVKGMSLIEVMIGCGVLGVLVGMALPIVNTTRDDWSVRAAARHVAGQAMLARAQAVRGERRLVFVSRRPQMDTGSAAMSMVTETASARPTLRRVWTPSSTPLSGSLITSPRSVSHSIPGFHPWTVGDRLESRSTRFASDRATS